MSSSQKRKAVRHAVSLAAELSLGKKSSPAKIIDAGYGGVFLQTDLVPTIRQLVQLQTSLPTGDRKLSFHAMVVHEVTEPNPQGRKHGLGIQFYALDPYTRAAWDRFIRSIEHSIRSAQDAPGLPPEMPSALRRRFVRHSAVLKVALPDIGSLRALHAVEFVAGKMFVACDDEIAPGKLVFVHITHPDHAATFLLEAVVESTHYDRPPAGVTVRFLGLDQARKQAFLDFIDAGVDTESEVSDDAPSIEPGMVEVLESELEDYETMIDDS